MSTITTNTTEHVFETAGLGKAPFKYLGCFEDRGPHKVVINGVQCEVGAPGQPMGTCKFCGQGIAMCCRIESADGKQFIVGSDCVMKTGDKGLKSLVRKEAAKRTKVREADRIEVLRDRLSYDNDLRGMLEGVRHPQDWAAAKGQTMLDQVCWMMRNAGHSGRIKMVRLVAKLEKAAQ